MQREELTQSYKFNNWKRKLIDNGLTVKGVEEVYTVRRYNGEVLFSLLLLDATTPEGNRIPPVCFLKGEVVCVLICLIDKETKERYLLLVKQRRICNGGYIYEHVAGMVDRDDNPLEVAIREAEEESGMKLTIDQLIPLNKEPYYPSSGTCDEAIYFYACEIELTKEEIMSYDKKDMGVQYEHERIQTCIVSIPDALKLITNVCGLLQVYLYLEAKGEFVIKS